MNEEGEMVDNFPTIGKEAWKVQSMINDHNDLEGLVTWGANHVS